MPAPSMPVSSSDLIGRPPQDRIGQLARTGAAWTTAAMIARQSVSVVTTAVLARFLLPSDYGVIGMVTTLTALLSMVAGLGLTYATMQRGNLSRQQVHNVFWINVGVGGLFWLVTIAVAPALATFYGEPSIRSVAVVMGASFLVGSIAAQPSALMHRFLRYRAITQIELGSQVASACVAIAMAVMGFGYWALVAQVLSGQIIRAVLKFTASGYRPGKPSRMVETRSLVAFGSYMTLSSLVTYVATSGDNILIGRVLGADALGLYTRAYFLMTLPTMLFAGSIERVMIPAMSALANDPTRLARAFRKTVQALLFAGLPTGAGFALTAPELVRLVYGPNWLAVEPILAWLSIGMVVNVVLKPSGWLYTVTGNTRQLLIQNLFFTSFLVAFFAVGIQYGTTGVAVAFALHSILIFVPHMYLSHRLTGFSLRETLRQMLPIVAMTVLMALLVYGAGALVGGWWDEWLLTLATKVATGVLAYALMSWLWLRPLPLPIPERVLRLSSFRWLRAWV